MNNLKQMICAAAAVIMLPLGMTGQETLTLEQCRDMAIQNNKALEQARTKVEMAGYDRKIARANYYPNISATGAYMYNQKSIALINDELSDKLTGTGAAIQGKVNEKVTSIVEAISKLPNGSEILQSQLAQTIIGALGKGDITSAITKVGTEIDDLLHPDTHNLFAGAVSLQQPVFMGGKIVNANRMAKLAEELSRAQYDKEYQDLLTTVDQAYWQVVSVSNKKRLAENFADLLEKMEHESLDAVPTPQMSPEKDIEQIYQDRPETRSLDLAASIYEKKMKMARADMMPKVALMANYMITNPNIYNGFEKKFSGMFNVGVAVNIPIFHGFEALQKTRKAKAEMTLYTSRLDEAKELINLQVTQLRKQLDESLEKVEMAENNLKSAEENLRTASVGFEAGVITTNIALAAHTAWLQAHSEYIDAGVELQLTNANLQKAEGNYKSDLN